MNWTMIRDYFHFSPSSSGLLLTPSSELPFGAGLGSSASLCACVAGALLTLCGKIKAIPLKDQSDAISFVLSDEDLQLVNEWAYCGETLIHGTPSGVDNTISTYGKISFLYRKFIAATK